MVTQTGTELTGTVGDWAAGSVVSFVYYNNEWVLQSPTLMATLNGTEYFAGNSEPTWYAPTTAGTDGYILASNGSGAPSWVNPNLNSRRTLITLGTLNNPGDNTTLSLSQSLSNFSHVLVNISLKEGGGATHDSLIYFPVSYISTVGYNTPFTYNNGSGTYEFTFPSFTSFKWAWGPYGYTNTVRVFGIKEVY